MATLTVAQAQANVEASYVEVWALESLSEFKHLKGSDFYDTNNVAKCLRYASGYPQCIEYADNNKKMKEIIDLLSARPGGIRAAYRASDIDRQFGRIDADLAKARAASKLAENVLRELRYPTRIDKAAADPKATTPIAPPKPPKKAPKKPLKKPKGRK